ncbi:hypothetical protein [Bradyrhizobium sp. dw_411]|uniref:hypothetical protein n=1 Tax=Bradyrhizobium sp. dw_411 TaxID=2720082 RepID=UPI001BCF9FC0|nr:hypothetical protein [Bradyrhizobium sp. dw_411]
MATTKKFSTGGGFPNENSPGRTIEFTLSYGKSELLNPDSGQPSYAYRIEFADPEDRAYVCAMYGPPRDEEGLNAFAHELGDAYKKVGDDPSYAGLPVPPSRYETQYEADRTAGRQIETGGIAQGCLWAQQFGPGTNLAINFANGAGANTYQAQALNGDNRVVAEQSGSANEARTVPMLGRRVVAQNSSDSDVGNSASSADGVDPVNFAQPTSLPLTNGSPVRRLVRVNANASPTMPVVSCDGQGSSGGLFENQTSSPRGISPRNRNLPVSAQEAENLPGSPLGIFSGKPMPLWTTPPPIFDTRDRSDAVGDQNRFAMLGGLLWGGGKSKASAGAPAAPSVLDGEESFSNGAASPESGSGAGIIPPGLTAQPPQKSPASLIMDYIQRLKPLEANPSRASAFDTGAPPVPFVSPDGVTGGLSGAASAPPLQNPQGPLSLMDAYLEYRKQLDASPPQASAFDTSAPAAPLVPAADANLSGGLPGRLAALMGVDPSNPDQFAPPPQDDELRGYYRDDPTQPWFVRR